MSLSKSAAVGILLLFVPVLFAQSGHSVEAVHVDSEWGGLGPHSASHLELRRSGDYFVGDSLQVPVFQLERLAAACLRPGIAEPDAANLGITAAWLREHADAAGRNAATLHYEEGTEEQKEIFRQAFAQDKDIGARLRVAYQSRHTDDYPHMQVAIRFADGTTVDADTASQNPFMLPWRVSRTGQTTTTYDAEISRALQDLLPMKFTNRSRLDEGGDDFGSIAYLLGEDSGSAIENRWNMAGSLHASGAALAVLRKSFTVRTAEVNSYHHLEYGKEWTGGKPHEENLHLTLAQAGLPPNLVINAVLLREHGQTQGAEQVAVQAERYEAVVLGVPWFHEYLRSHPKEVAWLFVVHGLSMTDKEMGIFTADMKKLHKPELAARVKQQQSSAAVVETGFGQEYGQGDYWILLPDKTAILWRLNGSRRVLQWSGGTLPMGDCTEYEEVGGGCSGAVISAEGQVVSR